MFRPLSLSYFNFPNALPRKKRKRRKYENVFHFLPSHSSLRAHNGGKLLLQHRGSGGERFLSSGKSSSFHLGYNNTKIAFLIAHNTAKLLPEDIFFMNFWCIHKIKWKLPDMENSPAEFLLLCRRWTLHLFILGTTRIGIKALRNYDDPNFSLSHHFTSLPVSLLYFIILH